MNALEGLKPEKVYKFFGEIAAIPHGSGNLDQISNYLVRFAEERGLRYIQDRYLNVIMFKDASSDNVNSNPVIIQGHMDMVTLAEDGHRIDFLTEPVALVRDGDFIRANRTTLGADDGIALAFALAVLDDDSLSHPPIEAVFTVDEEIGMLGAAAIDTSPLKGKYFLNIDSEEDGIFYAGCAGGATCTISRPFKKEQAGGKAYSINISGLSGGHSGVEIHRQSANACHILGRILFTLKESGFKINLFSVNGGEKDNAIAVKANAVFYTHTYPDLPDLKSLIKKTSDDIRYIYKTTDPLMSIRITEVKSDADFSMDAADSSAMIDLLTNLPNGIIRMSDDVNGMVETSLNLGVMRTCSDSVEFTYSVRSNIDCQKDFLIMKLKNIAEHYGAASSVSGVYGAWEYRPDSMLRSLLIDEYQNVTGRAAKTEVIHAGVECGIFLSKMPDLDCVSFGPQADDIHTPNEKMSISSLSDYWTILVNILARLAKTND